MHILVDITHPAHLHFFRHAVSLWRERGHRVSLVSRDKDVTLALLQRYQLEATCLGKAKRGLAGLGIELLQRDWRLLRLVRRLRPDVMVAVGGIFVAHVGAVTRIPAIVFTDTENDTLCNRLTFPLAKLVVTPDCYEAPVPKKRHLAYPGYHALAYVHPDQFTPDASTLATFGLEPDEPFILLRVVGWGAFHDLHDRGFARIEDVYEQLSQHGRVLISSEAPLPPALEASRVRANPELMHQLLYHARLFIGESATMTSESAVLGTPAIFVSTSRRGYTNEQERRYQMVFNFSDPHNAQQQALAKAHEILRDPDSKSRWQAKRQQLLNDKINVARYIADLVEKHA